MKTARPVASPDTETAERPAPNRFTEEAGGAVRRPVIRPRPQPASGLSSARSGVRGAGSESVAHTEVALDLGIADTAEIFVSPLLDVPAVDHVADVGHPVVDRVATGANPEAVQATDTPDVELSLVDRRRRRRRRRRLVREQLLILLVLFVALAVTVALLASQWLLNGSVSP